MSGWVRAGIREHSHSSVGKVLTIFLFPFNVIINFDYVCCVEQCCMGQFMHRKYNLYIMGSMYRTHLSDDRLD